MRGKFPSRKNGRMVHHEGMLEVDAIYLFEASPNVIGYREQAPAVHFADGSRTRRYTPDFEVDLADGRSVLVEVKPQYFLAQQETSHKLACVAAKLQRDERSFVVLTEQHLQRQPRQANARYIYHRAGRLPPSSVMLQLAAARCRQSPGPITIAAANALLAAYSVNAFSLLLAGLARCDMDAPLSPTSALQLPEETGDAWFLIANEHGL